MRNAYEVLAGKLEGKGPLGRTGHRWGNIRIDLTEILWEGVDWMHLAQYRVQLRTLMNTKMNLRLP
jgi:hypothetical protein